MRPAPPKKIVITTGRRRAYHYFGERYREKLGPGRHRGRAAPLVRRRREPAPPEDRRQRRCRLPAGRHRQRAGFRRPGHPRQHVPRTGVGLPPQARRPARPHRPAEGPADRRRRPRSGAQLFALQLLAANGFATDDPRLVALGGMDAVAALKRARRGDAFFVVGAPQAPVVDALLHTRASACSALPRPTAACGTSPPRQDHRCPAVPSTSAATSRPRRPAAGGHRQPGGEGRHPPGHRHPAPQARRDIHSPPGLCRRPTASGAPGPRPADAPDGAPFYDSGPPLLQRYLPFWLAVLIDRLFVMLLPLFAVVIPSPR